ncbi:MAG: FAD-binding protein [Bacteroidota bacterium]|nr:FAD-binding protein [Bacteroidota bacterium]
MHKSKIKIGHKEFPFIRVNTLIIGSGAAGLNAAVQLFERGIEDIAILTEKWGGGTSNNAGSDKQTYYRLAADGQAGDSVTDMAEALYKGGAMHGDIALIESATSLQAFNHLIACGVPFPHDEYGRYPGYRTDHDDKGRGTSAGPLTSRYMFQALAKKIVNYQIPIIDQYQAIQLLYRDEKEKRSVIGALAIDLIQKEKGLKSIVVFQAASVIIATGGPGGLYNASVYPESQKGSMGMALEIGAKACNLTESQFGIASVKFRWNLSGSYQQVIPRYFSVDQAGVEYEFLNEHFNDSASLSKAIFLKGYQWPFDSGKLDGDSSSLIDLLVYREKYLLHRRVFIDYRNNPVLHNGQEFNIEVNADELISSYLEKSNAVLKTPIERLAAMNQPAIDLFRKNGINLNTDPLEIDVCAQHCNGGLSASIWWESNIQNLFPVGEINGSHGVYRPGGSALNAGQVGGIRAAMLISSTASKYRLKLDHFRDMIEFQITETIKIVENWKREGENSELASELDQMRSRMSKNAGVYRNLEKCRQARNEARDQYSKIFAFTSVSDGMLPDMFYLKDHLISQLAILESIVEFLEIGGGSRGSFLVLDQKGNHALPWNESVRYITDSEEGFTRKNQLLVEWNGDSFSKSWQIVREIPDGPAWFETAWKKYRERKTIRR